METIGPGLGTLIIANNYFHDVATGLLMVSFAAQWVISTRFEDTGNPETARLYLGLYKTMTDVALFALVWIVAGGVPRTLFYSRLEWAQAAGDAQVPAIIVKHVFAFTFVAAGMWFWRKFGLKAKAVASAHGVALR